MANVIIKNDERREETDFALKKFGGDRNNPEDREAAEIIAARTREAVEMAHNKGRKSWAL